MAAIGAASVAAPAMIQRMLGAADDSGVRLFAEDRIPDAGVRLTGWNQGYLEGVTEQWLKVAPASNPAILEIFRDRDRRTLREMIPGAGEFAVGSPMMVADRFFEIHAACLRQGREPAGLPGSAQAILTGIFKKLTR